MSTADDAREDALARAYIRQHLLAGPEDNAPDRSVVREASADDDASPESDQDAQFNEYMRRHFGKQSDD